LAPLCPGQQPRRTSPVPVRGSSPSTPFPSPCVRSLGLPTRAGFPADTPPAPGLCGPGYFFTELRSLFFSAPSDFHRRLRRFRPGEYASVTMTVTPNSAKPSAPWRRKQAAVSPLRTYAGPFPANGHLPCNSKPCTPLCRHDVAPTPLWALGFFSGLLVRVTPVRVFSFLFSCFGTSQISREMCPHPRRFAPNPKFFRVVVPGTKAGTHSSVVPASAFMMGPGLRRFGATTI